MSRTYRQKDVEYYKWFRKEPKWWRKQYKHKLRRAARSHLEKKVLRYPVDDHIWPPDKKPWIYY